MKRMLILCVALLLLLSACSNESPEPERCSLCASLPCHAPCIINLSTGKLLVLAVYEPHPFIVGELAEEQQRETFSLIRGAGIEGYKLSAESITITVPLKAEKMNEKHFCKSCRELLTDHASQGYAIVDLKDPESPIVYRIYENASFALRCYNISVQEHIHSEIIEIAIVGTLQ